MAFFFNGEGLLLILLKFHLCLCVCVNGVFWRRFSSLLFFIGLLGKEQYAVRSFLRVKRMNYWEL